MANYKSGTSWSLLKEAGLEGVKKELSTLPDQQPLHLYLPDICRSRYDHPPDKELNSAIAPLLKDRKTAEARIRPFRDEELRAFALPPGPASSPLPLKPVSNEEEERMAKERQKLASKKRTLSTQDAEAQGEEKKRR